MRIVGDVVTDKLLQEQRGIIEQRHHGLHFSIHPAHRLNAAEIKLLLEVSESAIPGDVHGVVEVLLDGLQFDCERIEALCDNSWRHD